MPRLNYSDATVAGPDYYGKNLEGAIFLGANLKNANLSNCNLSNADLSSARLKNANLTGAKLTGTDLSNAKLSGANLAGCDLSNTDLTYADLNEANLCGAILPKSGMMGADLRNANLSGIDFKDINITNVLFASDNLPDLSGAITKKAETPCQPNFENKYVGLTFQERIQLCHDNAKYVKYLTSHERLNKKEGSKDLVIFTHKAKNVIKGEGHFRIKSDGTIEDNSFGLTILLIKEFELPSYLNTKQSQPKDPESKLDNDRNSSKGSKRCQKSSTPASKKPKVEKSPLVESSSNGFVSNIPETQNDTKPDDNDEIQQALKMSKSEFVSS